MSADNQIDYLEFQAADLAATRLFFEQLFGWKFTDYGPDYTSFEDGRIAGGFARAEAHSTIASGGVLVVFYHPRLEEVRQRVLDLGGTDYERHFLVSRRAALSFHRTERERVRDLVGGSLIALCWSKSGA